MRVCSTPGCPRLVAKGSSCPEHAAPDNRRRAAKTVALRYRTAHWQRVRRQRLAFAGGRCELKLDRCTGAATHVHLHPRLRGRHDLATIDDCRACCAQCSGSIDAPRAHETRRLS